MVLAAPVLAVPVLEAPVLVAPVLETPVLEAPVLVAPVLVAPVLVAPVLEMQYATSCRTLLLAPGLPATVLLMKCEPKRNIVNGELYNS